ncbi:unnamed protein product [Acanthocheilonema viteae]|uniref:Uncharacterized protein n=1 Tax=Acanthocheilonema viteae TaxID=6277 RepID=A0A498SCX4_ACAVI|nr:unnamed protein product [Acanthocheilonema viteae]
MNIAEYLSSSHPDDLRYRLSIAYAVRNLEQQQSQLVTSVDGNQLSAPWRSDEKFVRRFLIFGNSDGIYFARQTEFTCTLEPGLCRIIQSG